MKIKFCDLDKNYTLIKDEVNEEIFSVLDTCKYINGDKVTNFEQAFSSYIGMKHCIGVANGTDALEIAISSLNIPVDSEIIVQGNTCIATCFGVTNNSYKLVLCDVDKNTHMIDISELKTKITSKTKILILVHLYGFMSNMSEIVKICEENNIILIEDCAQSHGASYLNKKAGSFGKLSCFSFYPSKNLGAYGDGGCIMTNDDELNRFIRKKSNMGSSIKYHHEIIGRNSRLDTIQSSILNIKLKYLDENNNKRRTNANKYDSYLNQNKNIILPIIEENTNPVYHLYVIRAKNRDLLANHLYDNGIETLIHYPIPLCKTDALIPYLCSEENQNTIELCREILSLPMYPELKDEEIKYICEKINEFYNMEQIQSQSQSRCILADKIEKLVTLSVPNKVGYLHCINKLNFENIKRLFYVDGFENEELPIIRGKHAIINFNQLLIILEGKIKLTLIKKHNHHNKKVVILCKNDIFYIEENTWLVYEIQDNATKILVLCDKDYSDSIKEDDFEKFIKI